MFFSKRKILNEINEKFTQMMEIMENQSHTFESIENRFNTLEQMNQRNTESINHILEIMMELNTDSRQYVFDLLNEKSEQILLDSEKKVESLKAILENQERARTSLKESLAEKIGKIQEDYRENERETQEYLDSIKELVDVNSEMGKSVDEKLDILDNEIRLLLINSVMGQITEE